MAVDHTDPSYDFLYMDVEGILSGKPGTRCFIKCKATSGTAYDSSGRMKPFQITNRDWDSAQKVRNLNSDVFIVVWVEGVRVGSEPWVAAILIDPVKMVGEGALCSIGQQLELCGSDVR